MTPMDTARRAALEALLTSGSVLVQLESSRPDVVIPDSLRAPALTLRIGYHLKPDMQITTDNMGVTMHVSFERQVSIVVIPWSAINAMRPESCEPAMLMFLGGVQSSAPASTPTPAPEPAPAVPKRTHLSLVPNES